MNKRGIIKNNKLNNIILEVFRKNIIINLNKVIGFKYKPFLSGISLL